ncbi:EamA-like transporter family protein [Tistlia consotensis]|uniref:EamA-like transporter family protein n=1 Tax=Tistlia consotensis USBA 355 TaxID=560819 RepID=A0A1Y6B8Y4_9PROT|nr:DMT family transporter [Tistlia consotensis]SME91709.1 EamA-like transporter family protein [Tistlia consotensis USBA 355]SNR27576.1 EamA-like transporter family protein [Tistlia consotensis]
MSRTTIDRRPDRVARGAALIVGSVFLMSLQDAVIKYASADLPLWQLWLLRGLLALPALIAVAALRRPAPRSSLARALGGWPLLRAGLLVLMYLCLYAAVPVLSLSTVAAGFYTGPLFITLLSAVLLGEPVGRRGWLAVALGFTGVLVVLRPGGDAFAWPTLLPVLAGLFYACAAVATRGRCRDAAPVVLALALNLALLAAGLLAGLALALWRPTPAEAAISPFLFGSWAVMGAADWGLIGLLALLIVGIGIGLAAAYQAAPPVIVATFDYSYLIFAAAWSYGLFDEPPDGPTVAGTLMIAGAGLLVVQR